jgi:hypothetical protein
VAGQPQIAAVAGDLQSRTIGAVLPSPLVVQVTDASGNPLPGRTVLFQIGASNGSLLGNAGPDRYLRTTDTTCPRALRLRSTCGWIRRELSREPVFRSIDRTAISDLAQWVGQ